MAVIGALLDARTFAKLSNDEIERLTAVMDAAIIADPEIRAKLTVAIKKAAPNYGAAAKKRS